MKSKCYYDLVKGDLRDEYETSCGSEMCKQDLENIVPTFCPYCGEEICIN